MKGMKHKHAELIHAWADGEQIQWLNQHTNAWRDLEDPAWRDDIEYRIKPLPKHDFFQQYRIDEHGMPYLSGVANLRLYFDGETGKLKKAEVL